MNRLLAATALSCATLGVPAAAFDMSAMSEAERAAFGAEVRNYLMENPEVILEAVNQMEARQAETQAADDLALVQTNMDAIVNDGYSWVGGNPEGDVTVVEFLDYRCGYCRKAYDEVSELIESDGNIRLIVKELPILGEGSTISSRFAIAVKQVAGPEAYKASHDALMTFNGDLTDAALTRLAEGLGLDSAAILEAMSRDEVTQEIEQTRALAQRLQVRGTPTFVMGAQLIRGYVPLEAMREIVEGERG